MDQDFKAEWVAALRSGSYQQTKGTLRDQIGYCCLGVACDLLAKRGIGKWGYSEEGVQNPWYFDYSAAPGFNTTEFPREAAGQIGMEDNFFEVEPEIALGDLEEWRIGMVPLFELNDFFHFSFDQIADVIEEAF